MKKILLAIATLVITAAAGMAQAQKIAYIRLNYIVYNMPEYTAAEKTLTKYNREMDSTYEALMLDYQTMMQAYETQKMIWTEPVRKLRETELRAKQITIQEFELSVEQDMQKKQLELYEPMLAKVKQNINLVATELGYSYVFNSDAAGSDNLLMFAPAKDDISDLVLKKMGILTPKPLPKSADLLNTGTTDTGTPGVPK